MMTCRVPWDLAHCTMRSFCAPLLAALSACAPAAPIPQVTNAAPVQTQNEVGLEQAPPEIVEIGESIFKAETEATLPKLVQFTRGGLEFTAVSFDSKGFTLKVADQLGGPGAKFSDARGASDSLKGLAAINAGFFTPEGDPLGFLYTEGKKRGSLNRSSLGSGVFQVKNGKASLVRRQVFKPKGVTEALQSGPFLLHDGKVIGGLSQKRPRDRSILLTDGGSNWAIAQTSPTTLRQLADVLDGAQIDGWKVRQALNLDGGRSCDLYISGEISGQPISERSFIAKPVRNFLVLVRK